MYIKLLKKMSIKVVERDVYRVIKEKKCLDYSEKSIVIISQNF